MLKYALKKGKSSAEKGELVFLKGLEKVLKGGKERAKRWQKWGIIGVSTKQKGNEKGAKMGERGRPWGKHRAKM